MSITMEKTDFIALRKAGLKALNAALGENGTKDFLLMWRGTGDFTKERRERPEPTQEEVVAGINKLQEEGIKAGRVYDLPQIKVK